VSGRKCEHLHARGWSPRSNWHGGSAQPPGASHAALEFSAGKGFGIRPLGVRRAGGERPCLSPAAGCGGAGRPGPFAWSQSRACGSCPVRRGVGTPKPMPARGVDVTIRSRRTATGASASEAGANATSVPGAPVGASSESGLDPNTLVRGLLVKDARRTVGAYALREAQN